MPRKKETDMEKVRALARAFLYTDIRKTELSPVYVRHPFFESAIAVQKKGDELSTCNLLEDSTALSKEREKIKEFFRRANEAMDIMVWIQPGFRFAFIKYSLPFLSREDLGSLLAYAWTTEENPNKDPNVQLRSVISWFKKADQHAMMSDQEYGKYSSFPKTMTVYRGVAVGRNPRGLSWTSNMDVAKWFANRFNHGTRQGYVQAAEVKKEHILAYFNSRDEDEIVINVPLVQDRIYTL